MIFSNFSWFDQLESLMSALILLTSFMLLMQSRIQGMIRVFAWQSALLALTTLWQAMIIHEVELYLFAAVTFILKVMFFPYLMHYLVQKLNIRHKVATMMHPFLLLIFAAVLVLFCYQLMSPAEQGILLWRTNNVIAVALAVTLLGMMLLITHRKAVSHIIGFMSMENGIFFAALITAHGMPMAVELGIAFDVLVAMILFGVFFFHIRSSIDSLDVDRLNRLREDVE